MCTESQSTFAIHIDASINFLYIFIASNQSCINHNATLAFLVADRESCSGSIEGFSSSNTSDWPHSVLQQILHHLPPIYHSSIACISSFSHKHFLSWDFIVISLFIFMACTFSIFGSVSVPINGAPTFSSQYMIKFYRHNYLL